MEEKTEVFVITEQSLQDKIYTIRGQKVMLDVDLAVIYGYETKNFNRQVKNNSAKFDGDDFMFQLTKDEWENLRCKNFTSSWGGSRYLPMAFTEQGIYMLMTVLHGELAVQQSRALVRTFKKMKDYILDNRELIGQREYIQLSMQTAENVRDISKIKSDMGSVEKQMCDVMDLLEDEVSFVLVFKLSRFGRNAADVLASLQEMQDFGVNLICVEDGIDSSKDAGKLMISELSAVAEIERENIRIQTKEGRMQKAREGKWSGGFAPYGYKLVAGKLEINEEGS